MEYDIEPIRRYGKQLDNLELKIVELPILDDESLLFYEEISRITRKELIRIGDKLFEIEREVIKDV